jgi:hypothetical protein
MSSQHQIIRIQPAAPPKPVLGAPCNGCGVCCLWAPCPLGVLLSRRRRGACVAVSWQEASQQYRCDALAAPAALLPANWPGLVRAPLTWLLRASAPLVRRWIAAGHGCDSSLVVEPAQAPAAP